jgi:hypothetical protein
MTFWQIWLKQQMRQPSSGGPRLTPEGPAARHSIWRGCGMSA